jgi:hypothetical protein
MFKSAAGEISEWADRCRHWARSARSKEQRQMLQSWERLFSQADTDAQENFDYGYGATPQTPHKF